MWCGIAAIAYKEGKKVGKKKQKEKQKKKAKRQREIERQLEEKRQTIRELACLFTNMSLRNITFERLKDVGDNLEELDSFYKEESCAHHIELNAYILSNSHYRENIMQRLFDAYIARNFEELQTIADDARRFRKIDLLVQSIQSCSLHATLQELTDERVANADDDIEELERIKKEVFCAYEIEQCTQGLDEQICQAVYKELENAYRNRDFDTLQAIYEENENPKKPQTESQPITINDDGGSYEFLADTINALEVRL